jgi:uncharacterized protein YjdB
MVPTACPTEWCRLIAHQSIDGSARFIYEARVMRIQPLVVVRMLGSILLLLPLGSCCGEFFRGSNDIVSPAVISPINASIQPGTTQQFTATATFGDGSTGDVTSQVAWTSSNPAIATISSSGLATGITFGTVIISGNCQCYITNTNLFIGTQTSTITSIAVAPANAGVAVGSTQQFIATALSSSGTTSIITSVASWTSSNTAVATVSSSGLATGVSAGTATITASSNGIQGTATLTVQ